MNLVLSDKKFLCHRKGIAMMIVIDIDRNLALAVLPVHIRNHLNATTVFDAELDSYQILQVKVIGNRIDAMTTVHSRDCFLHHDGYKNSLNKNSDNVATRCSKRTFRLSILARDRVQYVVLYYVS